VDAPPEDREHEHPVPAFEWRRMAGESSAAPGATAIVVAGAVFVVASVLVLAVILGQRTGGGPGGPGGASASARRIDVVGDSLIMQARRPLLERLDRAGYVSSVTGIPAQGLTAERIRARLDAAARTPADVLVVATATNDARYSTLAEGARPGSPTYRDAIAALLFRFADRCVVMVNARDRTNPLYLPERAMVINGELADLERSHSNLVVVDWAGISRELPATWFSPDLLHFAADAEAEAPDSPSAHAYADALTDGIRRCMDRRSPRG
jgi:hypothetical protein